MRASTLFTLACTACTALAHANFDGSRCGAPEPPKALVKEAQKQLVLEDSGRDDTLFNPINVTVYMHVVTTNASANNFTQKMLEDQLVYMNTYYNPWNISLHFGVNGTDFTVNDAWAFASARSPEERAMKTALRRGGYRDLNLYFLSDLGNGLLGFCYFPVDNPTVRQLTLDGCINLAGSLPGGNVPRYNLGGTAAHEAGHWFGLFHVFQGSACSGKGDYVSDTAIQSIATNGTDDVCFRELHFC